MVTREKVIEEIEKIPGEHLEGLYRMIKALEVNGTDAESAEGVLDGSYLHMSSIRERVQRESIAQLQIRDRLAPLANLIDRLDSLYDRALNAIADNPEPRAATKVALILTTRLADDLRVCSLTSYLGYGLQALAFGGTIMELVGSLSYVGSSDDRAVRWAERSDRRRSFPHKVSEGIEATLKAVGEFNPATCEDWQKGYEIMCMAKHGNPYLSLLHGLRIDPPRRVPRARTRSVGLRDNDVVPGSGLCNHLCDSRN